MANDWISTSNLILRTPSKVKDIIYNVKESAITVELAIYLAKQNLLEFFKTESHPRAIKLINLYEERKNKVIEKATKARHWCHLFSIILKYGFVNECLINCSWENYTSELINELIKAKLLNVFKVDKAYDGSDVQKINFIQNLDILLEENVNNSKIYDQLVEIKKLVSNHITNIQLDINKLLIEIQNINKDDVLLQRIQNYKKHEFFGAFNEVKNCLEVYLYTLTNKSLETDINDSDKLTITSYFQTLLKCMNEYGISKLKKAMISDMIYSVFYSIPFKTYCRKYQNFHDVTLNKIDELINEVKNNPELEYLNQFFLDTKKELVLLKNNTNTDKINNISELLKKYD